MKTFAVIISTILSFIGVFTYWTWYMQNYNTFTDSGSGGLAFLGFILTIFGFVVIPYILDDILDD